MTDGNSGWGRGVGIGRGIGRGNTLTFLNEPEIGIPVDSDRVSANLTRQSGQGLQSSSTRAESGIYDEPVPVPIPTAMSVQVPTMHPSVEQSPPGGMANGTVNEIDADEIDEILTNGDIDPDDGTIPTPARATGNGSAQHQAVNAVENPIPEITVQTRVKQEVDNEKQYPGAVEVLDQYVKTFEGIELNYSYFIQQPPAGSQLPTTFRVHVAAGFRSGSATGATMEEAKALAAEACLSDICLFAPDEKQYINFRKVKTTDPWKDILFLLNNLCYAYGMKTAVYTNEDRSEPGAEVCYKCILGCYVTEGRAQKARVAMRIAALDMYNLIRDKYNSGTLAVSTYE